MIKSAIQFQEFFDKVNKKKLPLLKELPEYVVIAEQGAGKSSVLEAQIGLKLFPIGPGTSTRACTRIFLENIDDGEEYAVLMDHKILLKVFLKKIVESIKNCRLRRGD